MSNGEIFFFFFFFFFFRKLGMTFHIIVFWREKLHELLNSNCWKWGRGGYGQVRIFFFFFSKWVFWSFYAACKALNIMTVVNVSHFEKFFIIIIIFFFFFIHFSVFRFCFLFVCLFVFVLLFFFMFLIESWAWHVLLLLHYKTIVK